MKPYHKNPRQITRKQMDNLRLWLAELGDLSGIVHDLNTDEIIGGNQRGMVFDVNKCKVELIDGPHEPDEQGTVAQISVGRSNGRYVDAVDFAQVMARQYERDAAFEAALRGRMRVTSYE